VVASLHNKKNDDQINDKTISYNIISMINKKVDKAVIMSPTGEMLVTIDWILGEFQKPDFNYRIVGKTVFVNNDWSFDKVDFDKIKSLIRDSKISLILD
jgi:hypothetical protein